VQVICNRPVILRHVTNVVERALLNYSRIIQGDEQRILEGGFCLFLPLLQGSYWLQAFSFYIADREPASHLLVKLAKLIASCQVAGGPLTLAT